ncbi:vesicular inhibitory amino acid transporter-like [Gadus morhua]|uniref:vesicular inhibitory amino acid transporter-like n=1 Tax=Gadus morhua TaxID=8049 RepID=UPI0011B772BF|nr:vesicular inhibitory amino acid transporter-like [Gadus morhua]
MKWVGPGAKQQIITTLTSTGPRTTTSTSLLPPQYLRCFGDTGTHEAEEPRATTDTVSCMINSPVDSPHPSTADATRTARTPGLAGGKVGRRNQGVPAPEPGAAAQRRPPNVTGPQEEAQLEGALGPPRPSITTWEAGWNVTNAIQGMFVLGLPYALVRSGYLGLLLLVLAAWICNHTGTILVACLYEEEHHGCGLAPRLVRVRHSYQDIAEACCKGLRPNWAALAGWMVSIAQVVELLMTCTLYLVVSASLLSDSLWWTAVPRSACSLASVLLLLPCLVLTDLRPVSTLSMLCSLAHGLISLLVILYCLSASRGWSLSALSLAVEPGDFLVSVGVIIFSYTSQIFLPTLEGSMEHRGQFPTMLGHTHAAACVLKTAFSLLAVLTWGRDTSEVITDNLPANLRPFVNLGLVAKALLSYPLPFYSAAQILQTCFLRGTAASASPQARRGPPAGSRLGLLVRGGLLGTSYLLALLVPRFSLLMGLTGSVTGAAMTLTLPCLFHLRLRWCRLGARERLTDGAILSLGLLCSTSGLICSLKRLVEGL